MSATHEFSHMLVVEPIHKHTATMIFLHGSGANGPGLRESVEAILGREFTFPHIRILYPTASVRPYTPSFGELSTVWFDRSEISPRVSEDMDSITASFELLRQEIEKEVAKGIPRERIMIGGYSMGGGMSLLYGYGSKEKLAGVFAMSSFLNEKSCVYDNLDSSSEPRPPLFQSHGEADTLILHKWGKVTHERLCSYGISGTFLSLPGIDHELTRQTLEELLKWINQVLPQ